MQMKIEDRRITFPSVLNVKYSGKVIKETKKEVILEGVDEDSYVKIYTPFRGVAKLFLFEDGEWLDADSPIGGGFDLSSLGLHNMPNLDSDEEDPSGDSEIIA